jgi:hypothetical protein
MDLFTTDRVVEAANRDSEFQLAARFWNADVQLDAGEERYLIRIRDGRLIEFSRAELSMCNCDVRISAAAADWREFLQPIPRPFYQDLMAAAWRQGFRVDGDLTGFYPYYRAAGRLFEIIRALRSA